MNSIKELEGVIKFLYDKYLFETGNWEKQNVYKYNQSTKLVKHIIEEESIYLNIQDYLTFLSGISLIDYSQHVSSLRVKNVNSCLSKIHYYTYEKGEKGNIPIKKCINDLFGLRIITENQFDYDSVNQMLSNKYPKIKCTKKDEKNYKAIHIYFYKDNNNYQWELQLWYKGDEKKNKKSHKKHKQKYTKWENLKGGLRDV